MEKTTRFLDEYKNSAEKNANIAVAHICLAEYHHSNNKVLSEDHYTKANEHIVNMQRSSLYQRQKMYLNIIVVSFIDILLCTF